MGFCGLKYSGVPLARRRRARQEARRVRVLRAHGLEDRPLALVQHVEHVARVVDVVVLAEALLEGAEELVAVVGRTEEDGQAAGAEDQRLIELLELFLGGLVNRGDDGLAGLLGQIRQELHQRLRVVGGQAAGRLVQEHDDRIGHQLHGDVDALALTAGQDLALGLADLQVRDLLQAELGRAWCRRAG